MISKEKENKPNIPIPPYNMDIVVNKVEATHQSSVDPTLRLKISFMQDECDNNLSETPPKYQTTVLTKTEDKNSCFKMVEESEDQFTLKKQVRINHQIDPIEKEVYLRNNQHNHSDEQNCHNKLEDDWKKQQRNIQNGQCDQQTYKEDQRANFLKKFNQTHTPSHYPQQTIEFINPEQVFKHLLIEAVKYDNQYCIDCGWKLIGTRQYINDTIIIPEPEFDLNQFNGIHVSINHATFLCQNCAILHQQHYSVNQSFIKPITMSSYQKEANSQFSPQNKQNKVFSEWTQTQLHALSRSGGNKAFVDFMETYGLMTEPIQKRYLTIAAQYYRDLLKRKVSNGYFKISSQKPDYQIGRERFNSDITMTSQTIPYNNMDQQRILRDLLTREGNLNDNYKEYLINLEKENIDNTNHFKQICIHQRQILLANSNLNDKNLDELNDYKNTIIRLINPTLPPFFKPRFSEYQKYQVNECIEDRIIEPYSGHEDYFNKDEFSYVLNALGQFAGRTRIGLMNLGDAMVDKFNSKYVKYKNKEDVSKIIYEQQNVNDQTLSKQIPAKTQQPYYFQRSYKINDTQQQSVYGANNKDYKTFILENAPIAISRLQNLGNNVIINLGLFQNNNSTAVRSSKKESEIIIKTNN